MMKRIKCFIDRDKEEQYLNKMAQEGMAFSNLNCFNAYIPIGIYHFEKSNPNEYVYRLALRPNDMGDHENNGEENVPYTDIESVVRKKNWEYLRRKEPFELYSDEQEKISFYKKTRDIYRAFLVLLIFWLLSRAAVRRDNLFDFSLSEIIWLAGFCIAFFAIAGASHRCSRKIKDLRQKDNHRD